MAGLSSYSKDYLANQFAGKALYISAHTADPGNTGASEVAGGSYARKAASWTTSSGGAGVVSLTGTLPVIDVPASTTVAFLGAWDAVTAGNFIGKVDNPDEAFTGAGQYSVTSGSYTQT